MLIARYSCQILLKFRFSVHIFEKCLQESAFSFCPAVRLLVKVLPYPSRHSPQAEFNFCISSNVSFTQIRQLEIHIFNIFPLTNYYCSKLATFASNVLQIRTFYTASGSATKSICACALND